MTTATIARASEVKTAAEQLRHVTDWMERDECCDAFYGVYTSGDGQPQVHLRGLGEMKRLFAGQKANRKLDGSRYVHTITADGIKFLASEWLQAPNEREEVQVTL